MLVEKITEAKQCECGCGQPTSLARKTERKKGHVKGEPYRFLPNHVIRTLTKTGALHSNWKGGRGIMTTGYVWCHAPNHPKAKCGMVYEHVLIAEKALGHYLPDAAQVHHVNEIKSENRGTNLVICENAGYHRLLHQRTTALRSCGHADWRKCPYCKTYDHPNNMAYTTKGTARHLLCASRYTAERKAGRGING